MRCSSFLLLVPLLLLDFSDALDTKEIKKILPKQPKMKPTTTTDSSYYYDDGQWRICDEDCDQLCADNVDYKDGVCHDGSCTCA